MTRFVSAIIGVLVIVGVGGLVYYEKSTNDAAMQGTLSNSMSNDRVSDAVDNTQGIAMSDDDEMEDVDDDDAIVQSSTSTNTDSSGSMQTDGITATEIVQHNTRASCWASINGNVYDLTSWIPKHPGGEEAILQLCGTDGSAKFNKQHGGGAQQAAVLAGFKIGVLAN